MRITLQYRTVHRYDYCEKQRTATLAGDGFLMELFT